jgi:hypothetical protein
MFGLGFQFKMKYIKNIDDLEHVYNWSRISIYLYNSRIRNTILSRIGSEEKVLTEQSRF